MNKRQLKKNSKKCVLIIPDETNLLYMTDEERDKAYSDYDKFVKMYSYRKKYKNLKGKHLVYSYPMGEQVSNFMKEVSQRARKYNNPNEVSNMLLNSINDESNILLKFINDSPACEDMFRKLRSTPIKANVCVQTMEDSIESKKD